MEPDWSAAFDHFGLKRVSDTDKNKAAFVVSEEQKTALSSAGFEPGYGGRDATFLEVHVLSEERPPLQVSYYDSVREGADRKPETRMGRDIIRWAEIGETIGIGNIGGRVYAWKSDAEPSATDIGRRIANSASPEDVLQNARKAKGKPSRQLKQVSDFRRRPTIVAGALARANGKCEMPGCAIALFKKEDGRNFLEVHHVVTLAEGGDDTMANAAALCPMCHRELHFGAERLKKRAILQAAIAAKES